MEGLRAMDSEVLAQEIRDRLGLYNDETLAVVQCVSALRARVDGLEALVLFCWRQAAEGDPMYGSGGDGKYQEHALNEIEQRTRDVARALLEKKP